MQASKVLRPAGMTRLVSAVAAVGLMILILAPTTALAAPVAQDITGPERCALCHMTEAQAWQRSPHARALEAIDDAHQTGCAEEGNASDCDCLSCHTTDFDAASRTFSSEGVTCEACHGPYVAGHPDEGLMLLDIDSSICSDCHTETHSQWQQTQHAAAGVQCIGCHKSHSQDLRLTDEALCESCHRNEMQGAGHSAHNLAGLACLDCHTSPTDAASVQVSARIGALRPDHQFTVGAEICSDCHDQQFRAEELAMLADDAQGPEVAAAAGTPADIVDCEAAVEARRSAPTLAAASMGLGMGVGVMMGVAGVLVLGYLIQWRKRQ